MTMQDHTFQTFCKERNLSPGSINVYSHALTSYVNFTGMSLDELCEWVYFLLVVNKSMSGQDILIDNGEANLNNTFVWPTK